LFGVLQQIISGFWNRRVGGRKAKPDDRFQMLEFEHERINTLLDVIGDIPDDEKIIIWAKYHYDIEQIKAALPVNSYALFYGDVSENNRKKAVEQFRGDKRFFIATQSCGGHGLTLNEAHYQIFYNNGFKFSERIKITYKSI
jgi:SNF2 family DNA or RNA helicase